MGEAEVAIWLGWSSVTAVLAFVLALWLGGYLLLHSPLRRGRLAVLALLALAVYCLHNVLCLHVPAVEAGFLWRRFLGWLGLPALLFWFQLSGSFGLLPWGRAFRALVPAAYVAGGSLVGLWVLAPWTFSPESLIPLELRRPVALWGLSLAGLTLANLGVAWHRVRAPSARGDLGFLLLASLLALGGMVVWPALQALLRPPLSPPEALALGQALLILGLGVLAWGVARRGLFLAGRAVALDFAYHAVAIFAVVVLYLGTLLGLALLASALGFNALALSLVGIGGLAILTHLLADRARSLWDALFFRRWWSLRRGMRTLAQEIPLMADPAAALEPVIRSLPSLLGVQWAGVAFFEGGRAVIRVSSDPNRLGEARSLRAPEPWPHTSWTCPLPGREGDHGLLLLGPRTEGIPFTRDDEQWLAHLALRLGALLDKVRQRERATRSLAEAVAQVEALQDRESHLQESIRALLGQRAEAQRLDPGELREALFAYCDPDRLAHLLARPGTTLHLLLPPTEDEGVRKVYALQQRLLAAVEGLKPSTLPSLEQVRARAWREKRRAHLPSALAHYYTLRLVMAGYTLTAIADELGVSPRQVHNYLRQAVERLRTYLEGQRQTSEKLPP